MELLARAGLESYQLGALDERARLIKPLPETPTPLPSGP